MQLLVDKVIIWWYGYVDKGGLTAALVLYLRQVNITLPAHLVTAAVRTDPDYPSLIAASRSLETLQVPAQTIRLNPEALSQLNYPLLVRLTQDREVFGVLSPHTSGHYQFKAAGIPNQYLSYEELTTSWSGHAILAEPNPQPVKTHASTPALAIGLLSAVFLMLWLSGMHYLPTPLMISQGVKLAALGISLILFLQDQGWSQLAEQLCNPKKSGSSCTMLSKTAGNLLPGLSWSALASFYFASMLVLSMASTQTQQLTALMQLSQWLSFGALSVVIYSVSYQGLVAKTWCRLCMSINLLLCIDALILHNPYTNLPPLPPYPYLFFAALIALLIATLLYTLTLLLRKDKDLTATNRKYNRFRFSEEARAALLSGADTHGLQTTSSTQSVKGTLLLCLACPYCKTVFQQCLPLLRNEATRASIEVFVGDQTKSSPAYRKLALALYALRDQTQYLDFIERWYDQYDTVDPATFLAQYAPLNQPVPQEAAAAFHDRLQRIQQSGIRMYPSQLYQSRLIPAPLGLTDFF